MPREIIGWRHPDTMPFGGDDYTSGTEEWKLWRAAEDAKIDARIEKERVAAMEAAGEIPYPPIGRRFSVIDAEKGTGR